MKHKKIWMALFIVFLAGVLTGAVLGIVFGKLMHMPPPFRGGSPEKHIARKIGEDLQLSSEQKASFMKLLKPRSMELHKKHLNIRDEVSNMIDECIEQISPPLSDAQLKLLKKMNEERDRRFREEDRMREKESEKWNEKPD